MAAWKLFVPCFALLFTARFGVEGFIPSNKNNVIVKQNLFDQPNQVSYNAKSRKQSLALLMSEKREYSKELLLREEVESPFRKVRFFGYASLGAGALTSFFVSAARIAAAAAGINTDLMQESLTNAGIDLLGITILGILYKRDLDAQESRLKRAAKGADLAKLTIRVSSSILENNGIGKSEQSTRTVPLSSLRRGRGIDKRVVIVAGGKDKIKEVIEDVKVNISLQESLKLNDLIVVPVVMPQGIAPIGVDIEFSNINCIAFPAGGNWIGVIGDEASQASEQGVDIDGEGFCIIMKKNGKVGQRTKGVRLRQMVGDVEQRAELGMDTSNI